MPYRNLKQLRLEHGLKQKDLAYLLDVSQNTYSQYETGIITLTDIILQKLANFYGVSTDYLLDRTDMPMPYPKQAQPEELAVAEDAI